MLVLSKLNGQTWNRIGVTEVIMDNLNPQWVKQFDVQYNFEVRETFKVDVYDIDDPNALMDFSKHDYVGSLEFSLHEVVPARDQTLERPLVNNARGENKNGMIRITAEEKKVGASEEIIMRPKAKLGCSGYCFFLVCKQIGANNWKPVYKSEIKPLQNGFYDWNMVNLLTSDIAQDGNIDFEFKIEFYQSAKSGKHANMGHVNLSIVQA